MCDEQWLQEAAEQGWGQEEAAVENTNINPYNGNFAFCDHGKSVTVNKTVKTYCNNLLRVDDQQPIKKNICENLSCSLLSRNSNNLCLNQNKNVNEVILYDDNTQKYEMKIDADCCYCYCGVAGNNNFSSEICGEFCLVCKECQVNCECSSAVDLEGKFHHKINHDYETIGSDDSFSSNSSSDKENMHSSNNNRHLKLIQRTNTPKVPKHFLIRTGTSVQPVNQNVPKCSRLKILCTKDKVKEISKSYFKKHTRNKIKTKYTSVFHNQKPLHSSTGVSKKLNFNSNTNNGNHCTSSSTSYLPTSGSNHGLKLTSSSTQYPRRNTYSCGSSSGYSSARSSTCSSVTSLGSIESSNSSNDPIHKPISSTKLLTVGSASCNPLIGPSNLNSVPNPCGKLADSVCPAYSHRLLSIPGLRSGLILTGFEEECLVDDSLLKNVKGMEMLEGTAGDESTGVCKERLLKTATERRQYTQQLLKYDQRRRCTSISVQTDLPSNNQPRSRSNTIPNILHKTAGKKSCISLKTYRVAKKHSAENRVVKSEHLNTLYESNNTCDDPTETIASLPRPDCQYSNHQHENNTNIEKGQNKPVQNVTTFVCGRNFEVFCHAQVNKQLEQINKHLQVNFCPNF